MASNIVGLAQAGLEVGQTSASASAQELKGKIERQQADFRARVSDFQAQDALRRGKKEAALAQRAASKTVGSQRAALAAQGIVVDDEIGAQLERETREVAADDARTIRNNARREAFGFKVKAADERFKGALAERAAQEKARSTLLTGGLKAGRGILKNVGGIARHIKSRQQKKSDDRVGELAPEFLRKAKRIKA